MTEERKEALLVNVSIFDLLRLYGIEPKQAGDVTSQIRCPFHGRDSKPSARVYADTNKIYCFTCHSLYDIFSFVMAKEQLSFQDSLAFLEAKFGYFSVDLTGKPEDKDKVDYHEISLIENLIIQSRHKLGLSVYINLLGQVDRVLISKDRLELTMLKDLLVTELKQCSEISLEQ